MLGVNYETTREKHGECFRILLWAKPFLGMTPKPQAK
jgi:hypothetical protein